MVPGRRFCIRGPGPGGGIGSGLLVLARVPEEPEQEPGEEDDASRAHEPVVLHEHPEKRQQGPDAEQPQLGLEPAVVVGDATAEEHGTTGSG